MSTEIHEHETEKVLDNSVEIDRSLPASRAARTREIPVSASLLHTASPIPPVAPVTRMVLDILHPHFAKAKEI
jgi:hypothetical protein